jgi:hypothetical protein
MPMPSLEFEWDMDSASVPLPLLLTGIYRANVLCFMIAIILSLLLMLAVVYVLAERAHATLLEVKVGQERLLEALRAVPGGVKTEGSSGPTGGPGARGT